MKIGRFEIVTAFEVDKSIILSCGPTLKILQNSLGGRVFTINAPDDAPPALPRVILKSKDTIFNVAFDRFQITTHPPSHVASDITSAITFARQRSHLIIPELQSVITTYRWTGVIIEIIFPEDPLVSKSSSDAVIPIFDKLIKIDRKKRPLASFQLLFGINEDDYFTTYTIGAYEGRKIALNLPSVLPPEGGYIAIEPSEYPLTECGIKILIDINNKPSNNKKGPIIDLDTILDRQSIKFKTLITDLNLEGIIK